MRRGSRTIAALAAVGFAMIGFATNVRAQTTERPIDRWLIADVDALIPGANPLQVDGVHLFPDRDLEVGPGYWRLVREDGRATFAVDAGGVSLAHAYVKALEDVTVDIALPRCEAASAWVNGQPVFDASGTLTTRLAGGWNTLLLAVPADAEGCSPEIGAVLSAPSGPTREDERETDLESLVVQASKPPGARPNFPEGVLHLEQPMPVALLWNGAEEELRARVDYALTAWGRPPGLAMTGGADDEIPTGPPAVDLTGEWSLTLYAPTGIIEGHATLEMAESGELTGRMDGERLSGEIRDGWVSGEEFGWTIEIGGRRGGGIMLRGTLADDVMSGTLDFGGFREFEARFEGERAVEGENETEEGAADEESPSEPDRNEGGPPGRPGGAGFPGARDELAAPEDLAGQRAAMIRALLPPPDRALPPAPEAGSIELKIHGEESTAGVGALVPLRPEALSGQFEFDRVRSAALDEEGVSARVEWHDDDYEFVGTLDPAAVLEALHAPIRLAGWGLVGETEFAGTFRVPGALRGFTLEVGAGRWIVGGSPLTDGTLCSPCREGVEFEISVTGTDAPTVRIVDPGYPAASAGAPSAAEWLEALRGDNERYLELARQFAGATSTEEEGR
jgi:hypothetical protein